jgi:phosphoribosyl 1,2-cyclic phosphodiesterase
MLEVCALSSGSSGNCFLVNQGKSSILIDAGISCKKIEERMNCLGKKVENVKGIFVTHEHSDHIKGIDVFSRKFNVPVFATKSLIENKLLCSNESLLNTVKNEDNVLIGKMEIISFPKIHRAIEPIGFSIIDQLSGKRVSVITDAGHICSNIAEQISESNALFLESNHDLEMLEKGPYPYFLKKWIGGDNGHLSNLQSSSGILENASSKLKFLTLCHLSEHNNTSEIALGIHKTTVKRKANLTPKIIVSTKNSPSEMIKLF